MNRFAIFPLLFLTFFSGCISINPKPLPASDYYYLNPNKNLSSIGRTVLVELNNDSRYPRVSADMTESLYRALQKKQVFGVTVIRQNHPASRSLKLKLACAPFLESIGNIAPDDQTRLGEGRLRSAYSLEQLFAIRKKLKCDAILVGTITGFKPYPHMVIGLRLKMTDLSDGQVLWALEQIWDSTDKNTEERIKDYYEQQISTESGSLRQYLGSVSRLNFLKFVSFEVAETLKSRIRPQKGTFFGLGVL